MDPQPRILFLTLTNDVGSDRIVSHLGREGAECAVIGTAGSFASRSRFVRRHVALPAFGGRWLAALMVRRRLEALVDDWHPDLAVPLDDLAAQLLRSFVGGRRASPALRRLLVRSLGAPAHYGTVCSRDALMQAAIGLGIRTPAHRQVPDLPAALLAAESFGYPVVLKREQTCGGGGVAIAEDAESLIRAFRSGERKIVAKRPLQRLLGCGGTPAVMTLQKFLPGRLAMRTVACQDGRVLDGISFEAERLHPVAVGSSTVIRPVMNEEMQRTARQLVEKLGCSGIVSFDFLLGHDDTASLIEMNPRPIGSGHLGRVFGHDLYAALLVENGGRPRPRMPSNLSRRQAIALFPKELDREPQGLGLDPAMFHDVPWDEPGIVAAYRDWLMQRHPDQASTIARLLSGPDPDAATTPVSPDRAPRRRDPRPKLAGLAQMPG